MNTKIKDQLLLILAALAVAFFLFYAQRAHAGIDTPYAEMQREYTCRSALSDSVREMLEEDPLRFWLIQCLKRTGKPICKANYGWIEKELDEEVEKCLKSITV